MKRKQLIDGVLAKDENQFKKIFIVIIPSDSVLPGLLCMKMAQNIFYYIL